MRVLLSGGGTAGSVVPLIALAKKIKEEKTESEFLFIGTRKAWPEKQLIKNQGIYFSSIHSGKLRRYFDWRNFFDLFLIFIGFFQSIFLIKKFKPDISISAGGFVSVPVNFAAFVLKVPILIHQQDIVPGLANRLIAPFAKKITVTFEKSLNDFPKNKTILTGNPIRLEILQGDKDRAIKEFNLEKDLPTVLIFGGGTGSKKINEMILKIVPDLIKFCQLIHLTGKNKILNQLSLNRYHQYEFLSEKMADAYAIADLVVSRAGMGTLTELSFLAKPSILIPIPDSHQEKNANYFRKNKAAVVLNQKSLTPEILLENIKKILENSDLKNDLSKNVSQIINKNAIENIIKEIEKIV